MLQECFPDRFLNILKAPKVSYYRFFLWETCIFARQTSKQTKGRNWRNKLTKPQESSRIKAQVPEMQIFLASQSYWWGIFYLVSDIMFIECISQRASSVNIFQDKTEHYSRMSRKFWFKLGVPRASRSQTTKYLFAFSYQRRRLNLSQTELSLLYPPLFYVLTAFQASLCFQPGW